MLFSKGPKRLEHRANPVLTLRQFEAISLINDRIRRNKIFPYLSQTQHQNGILLEQRYFNLWVKSSVGHSLRSYRGLKLPFVRCAPNSEQKFASRRITRNAINGH